MDGFTACRGRGVSTQRPALNRQKTRFFRSTNTVRTVSPACQGFRGQFAEGLLVGGGEMTGLGKAQAVRQIHQLQVTRAGAAQTVACQLQTALLQIAQRTGLQIVAEGLLRSEERRVGKECRWRWVAAQ